MATDVPLRLPVNALVSYHYFAEEDISEMAAWGLRLIGDSGAYSAMSLGAPISLESFAGWAEHWKDDLAWVASLDEIGDAEGTWRNWQRLTKMGLDTIPTVHYGADPKELDRYADKGVDFVGLGGMVAHKGEAERLLRWCLSMFRYARDNHPEMRFHGWGVTHPSLINNLPWYSVDSSGFSSAYRYGNLQLFDPRNATKVMIRLDGKDIYKHARLLRDEYGVDPAKIDVSNNETRRDLCRTAISAVQKREAWLKKRHNYVSAPVYGLNRDIKAWTPEIKAQWQVDGSQVHVVSTHKKDYSLAAPGGPNIHVVSTGPYLGVAGPPGTETRAMGMPRHVPKDQGPHIHAAIGFPSSQATKCLSPYDDEPPKVDGSC